MYKAAINEFRILLNVEVALTKDSTQLPTSLNNIVITDNQLIESYCIYYESDFNN